MPRAAEARAWWADVEDVRERIERKRERERQSSLEGSVPRRGVREVRPGRRLTVIRAGVPSNDAPSLSAARRRPRRRLTQSVGPRPDRVAAWAVVLGFALVFAAILSAH